MPTSAFIPGAIAMVLGLAADTLGAPAVAAGQDAAQDAGTDDSARPVLAEMAELPPLADDDPSIDNDFADLDFEDLFAVEVTSVTGSARSILGTPSAITRIGPDDIERSGYRHLAETLRLVPGLDVGRISNNQWGISVRGFSDVIANKLQVQVDGRSVYTTAFSGTLWETLDLPLYDVEAIEVVRGPGATLWGENAVNGVVSVRTKSAFDTQGVYLRGATGTSTVAAGDFRFGGLIDDDTAFRIYLRGSELASNDLIGDPRDSADDSMFGSGGFRLDRRIDDETTFTLDGRAYNAGRLGKDSRFPVLAHLTRTTIREDERLTGGHLRARLERRRDDGSGWFAQFSADRLDITRFVREGTQDGIDLSMQATNPIGEDGGFLTWGAQYLARRTSVVENAQVQVLTDEERWDNSLSAFVQAELPLGDSDELTALIGTKVSHNDFSGLELQPSARLAWTPTDDFAAWGAVSRAVRTPALTDQEILFIDRYADTGLLSGGPASNVFVPIGNSGHPDTDSEELLAFESGVRWRPAEDLTIDAAVFYNDYDELRITSPFMTNFNLGNNASGAAWGGEIELTWQAAENWRLTGAWSVARLDLDSDRSAIRAAETSPEQMAQLRSSLDLTDELRFDSILAWTDERPYFKATAGANVDDYFRLDAGLTWRPKPNVELSVWGRNLLDGEHPEFRDDFFASGTVGIERDVLVELTFRF